ncbi:MAG: CHAP domain-containing protein [Rhizomicrobium sp.]
MRICGGTTQKAIYGRAPSPSENAVMVFAATRSMRKGHVAVVTKLVSDRQIVVDHANWMRDGRVYLNMPVMDVSPGNDWSQVRVWNARDGQWAAASIRSADSSRRVRPPKAHIFLLS